jgi:ribonucleoside-diphosphate reductase alpha chain
VKEGATAVGGGSPSVAASDAGANANPVATAASSVSSGPSSPARDELAVVAANGQATPAKASNGNGSGTVTLSLGKANVAFKIQEDAPSCAECGSIMVRNGSCYKCLNCGSTSGCS